MKFPKLKPWRSEKHRRNVAALSCIVCGRFGPSQCAHINFSKGMASKVSDALTFPACPSCHSTHDQGGISRQERWKREWEYVDATRALLIRSNQWSSEVEEAYQLAIVPLARVVHPEKEKAACSEAALGTAV